MVVGMEEPPIPLVPTKLTPPTPPTSLVARPRLMKALDSVVDDPNRRLALVSVSLRPMARRT